MITITSYIMHVLTIYKHWLLTQIPPVQHVKHTSWRANDDVRSLRLEFLHFVPHVGAANAGMARSTHVVTQGQDDLLNLESRQKQMVQIKRHAYHLQVLTFGSPCGPIISNSGQVWSIKKVISIKGQTGETKPITACSQWNQLAV